MIRPTVEFSEGTYKAIWGACIHTTDKNLNEMFKEQVKKVEKPVLHYEMIEEYMTGILDNLDAAGVDTKVMRHNLNKAGYYREHYTFQRV
jgi:hypothetical protein